MTITRRIICPPSAIALQDCYRLFSPGRRHPALYDSLGELNAGVTDLGAYALLLAWRLVGLPGPCNFQEVTTSSTQDILLPYRYITTPLINHDINHHYSSTSSATEIKLAKLPSILGCASTNAAGKLAVLLLSPPAVHMYLYNARPPQHRFFSKQVYAHYPSSMIMSQDY